MEADMRLRRDVQAALDWDRRFDARDIAISVKDGVVTLTGKVAHAQLDADAIRVSVEDGKLILSGEVHSLRERNDAEAAAWAASGVRQIGNRIRVQL